MKGQEDDEYKMSYIAVSALSIFGELLLYFLIGGILPFSGKKEKKSLFETVIAGWVVTTALFEVIALITVRSGLSLTSFAQAASVILALMIAFSVVLNFQSIFRGTSVASGGFHLPFSTFLVLLAIGASAALALVLPASGDPGHVLSQMAADLASDTMAVAVPGSDTVKTVLTPQEFLVRYSSFDIFLCKLTGLNPLIQMRIVRTAVTALLNGMLIYRIFVRLFERNPHQGAAASLLTIFAGIAFRTLYTPYGMLYAEGWSGNASLSLVLLPALILIVLALYDQRDSHRPQILLIISGIAAVSLSPVSLMVYTPAMIAALLSLAIAGRQPRQLIVLMLSLPIPAAAILFYYSAAYVSII